MESIFEIRFRNKYNFLLEDSQIIKKNLIIDKDYFSNSKDYFSIIGYQYKFIVQNELERFFNLISEAQLKFYWIYDGCNPEIVNILTKRTVRKIEGEKLKKNKLYNNTVAFSKIFEVINPFNCFKCIVSDETIAIDFIKKVKSENFDFIDYINVSKRLKYNPSPSYSDEFKNEYANRSELVEVQQKKSVFEDIKIEIEAAVDSFASSVASRLDWNYFRYRRSINGFSRIRKPNEIYMPTDTGRGINIIIIENGWDSTIPDVTVLGGRSRTTDAAHGNSVINFIKTEIPDAKIYISGAVDCYGNQNYDGAFLVALEAATRFTDKHNIILFETQTIYRPIETDSNELFSNIWLASNWFNITVVEPAANDGINFDTQPDLTFGDGRSCTDSGAIMIGAVHDDTKKIVALTNFGSRVDCYIWENITISDPAVYSSVGNTSGASAIAAVIIGIIQSILLNELGRTLNYIEIREKLGNNNAGGVTIDYTAIANNPPTNIFTIKTLNDLLQSLDIPYEIAT